MKIIGIDLSGPANHKDTVVAVFNTGHNELIFEAMFTGASDEMLMEVIISASLSDEVVIGMDAPLSYQDGGGDRSQDKSIRQFIKEYGLSGSSIMPPTLTKMVYLTLRGVSLSRRIMTMQQSERIHLIEVHPGAAIGTRIGEDGLYHALHYKKEMDSRKAIAKWFETIGLRSLPYEIFAVSHEIDACAAALAAWHWVDPAKQPSWYWKNTSPQHPFEFCC